MRDLEERLDALPSRQLARLVLSCNGALGSCELVEGDALDQLPDRLKDGESSFADQELVETGATYWHTIDFLWVIIFSLLYVMR